MKFMPQKRMKNGSRDKQKIYCCKVVNNKNYP